MIPGDCGETFSEGEKPGRKVHLLPERNPAARDGHGEDHTTVATPS